MAQECTPTSRPQRDRPCSALYPQCFRSLSALFPQPLGSVTALKLCPRTVPAVFLQSFRTVPAAILHCFRSSIELRKQCRTRLGIRPRDLGLLYKYSLGHCGLSTAPRRKLAFTSRHYALLTDTDTTALY